MRRMCRQIAEAAACNTKPRLQKGRFAMLVLSRKNRESVVIGGTGRFHRPYKVTVLEIRGANVKLGFDVDPEVPVHRAEVWEKIVAEAEPPA
jgi:carbon storage regulator